MTEFHWYWGPFALLVVGKVWAFDVGRVGIWGVGWRVGFRRIKA